MWLKSISPGIAESRRMVALAALMMASCSWEWEDKTIRTHLPDQASIATVNGRAILYEDIRADDSRIHSMYERGNGHPPSEGDHWREFERMKFVEERENLLKRITDEIREQKIRSWGIAAGEGRIREAIEAKLDETGVDRREMRRAIERSIERSERLIRALEAVRAGELSIPEAHERFLSKKGMSLKEWKSYAQTANGETLAKLRVGVATLKAEGPAAFMRPLVERELRGEQVSARIDEEMTAEDKSYADSLRRWKEEGDRDARSRVLALRGEWWHRQFQKADVEILHPRFQGVWEEFLYVK